LTLTMDSAFEKPMLALPGSQNQSQSELYLPYVRIIRRRCFVFLKTLLASFNLLAPRSHFLIGSDDYLVTSTAYFQPVRMVCSWLVEIGS